MSAILAAVKALIGRGEVQVSLHGFRELATDDIKLKDVLDGIDDALQIEEYAAFGKGPCVLVMQRDSDGGPLHVVWGIPKGHATPAVLVTAYRPDPKRWTTDFMRRRKP